MMGSHGSHSVAVQVDADDQKAQCMECNEFCVLEKLIIEGLVHYSLIICNTFSDEKGGNGLGPSDPTAVSEIVNNQTPTTLA